MEDSGDGEVSEQMGVNNKEAAWKVALTVHNNYDKLPENVRNELLVKLAEDKEAAGIVARTVYNNFDKLHDSLRIELLVKLAIR